jgi:single-stranded-DNA-specific exonuclease
MRWTLAAKISSAQKKQLAGFDGLTAQLLVNRGITTSHAAKLFFSDDLKLIPDPKLMPGITKAAETILEHIRSQKKIYIYGDYDADGVSATAILFDFLYRKLGADVLPYIPSRFDEGYGMGSKGLDFILAEGGKLVITVDCGIRDHALVEKYSAQGLNFIITDHHSLPEDGKLPDKALAVVHPQIKATKYPDLYVCGTNVAWKLVRVIAELALKQKLIRSALAEDEYLDLVALATVCDIMPLLAENRIIVKRGLARMGKNPNRGISELIRVTNINIHELSAYHLGFVIGPRINAGGRIAHALDAVRLLTSNNADKVFELSSKLNRLNIERQQLTEKLLNEAEASLVNFNGKLIFVSGEDWPEGVIGLVAGKLAEKYNLPAIAASVSKGIAKGSARSVKGFNITEAIGASAPLLLKYGGHQQAAGFTLEEQHLAAFKESLETIAGEQLTEELTTKELKIDTAIELTELDQSLLETIRVFEPFGVGSPQPTFLLESLIIKNLRTIGAEHNHLKLTLLSGNASAEAIMFNRAKDFADLSPGAKIDLAGNIELDTWKGDGSLQIKVKDIKHV